MSERRTRATPVHFAALAALVVCALALSPSRAQEDPLGEDIAIDDPSGTFLPLVHAALERARTGGGVARFSFWGASHTASDQYTGFLRERLVARFGDGGAGFFSPAPPFSLYARRDLALESAGFVGVAIRGTAREPGRYGRAGMRLDAGGRASASVRPVSSSARIAHVEAWYLAREGGGTLRVSAGGVSHDASTASPTESLGYVAFDVTPGAHTIEVETLGDGPVQLYGVLAESGTSGVIVESFGVPGARARDQALWETETFVEHVARRPPDVFAIAYGTNESGDSDARHPPSEVESDVRTTIARLRRAAPNAACLVIGPSDRPRRSSSGRYAPRPRTTSVNDAVRRGAHAERCGFFDLLAFQGGPGSIVRWVERGWALSDHVHMTDEGHERLAEVLEHALAP